MRLQRCLRGRRGGPLATVLDNFLLASIVFMLHFEYLYRLDDWTVCVLRHLEQPCRGAGRSLAQQGTCITRSRLAALLLYLRPAAGKDSPGLAEDSHIASRFVFFPRARPPLVSWRPSHCVALAVPSEGPRKMDRPKLGKNKTQRPCVSTFVFSVHSRRWRGCAGCRRRRCAVAPFFAATELLARWVPFQRFLGCQALELKRNKRACLNPVTGEGPGSRGGGVRERGGGTRGGSRQRALPPPPPWRGPVGRATRCKVMSRHGPRVNVGGAGAATSATPEIAAPISVFVFLFPRRVRGVCSTGGGARCGGAPPRWAVPFGRAFPRAVAGEGIPLCVRWCLLFQDGPDGGGTRPAERSSTA